MKRLIPGSSDWQHCTRGCHVSHIWHPLGSKVQLLTNERCERGERGKQWAMQAKGEGAMCGRDNGEGTDLKYCNLFPRSI
jgi:hypothetical protein